MRRLFVLLGVAGIAALAVAQPKYVPGRSSAVSYSLGVNSPACPSRGSDAGLDLREIGRVRVTACTPAGMDGGTLPACTWSIPEQEWVQGPSTANISLPLADGGRCAMTDFEVGVSHGAVYYGTSGVLHTGMDGGSTVRIHLEGFTR